MMVGGFQINDKFILVFFTIFFNRLGVSHNFSYPHRSLLVKLRGNRYTCLTNPVKKEQSLK